MQKDAEAAKLKEVPVAKVVLNVIGSACIGWLVRLVPSPVLSPSLNIPRGFSLCGSSPPCPPPPWIGYSGV